MLQARGITAGYGASQVLFGIDLDIAAGQIVTLLGRNGMGKTTLIRTLTGVLSYQGSIRFLGADIGDWSIARIARHGMAVVPEGRQCFPNLTVMEHLTAFADRRNPVAEAEWTPQRVLDLFPRLAERQQNLGHQLSGGEQQMLAIGRALVTNPRLLVLDEATEGLAPQIREEIWRCLDALRSLGQTILVIDKYIERLLTLADEHVIIEKGTVAWHGRSVELDADRTLWARYLGV
ncbi:MAG TPA: ABC transporter ATP-binding protein [Burkholderiaceae bacterium]|nr:ABC transporter ATP-binding protein [Burkholderiaceae bacterium]